MNLTTAQTDRVVPLPMSGTCEAPNGSATSTSDSHEAELISISWNQDFSHFAAVTSDSFCIYSSNPFKEILRRNIESGRFKFVEMLFQSNYMALVGSETDSHYPPNKVMIWDDNQSRFLAELTFRSHVRGVKLRIDCVFVVLEHNIYVYNLADLKLLDQIETRFNPKGLCCLSHNENTNVLACPGLLQGQVRIERNGRNGRAVTMYIDAHNSDIACLTLTLDGLLLATASTKGTLIRIFSTVNGTRLQEVRQGASRADIYSIALSTDVQWLALSSDKGTIHIFRLQVRACEDNEICSNAVQNPASLPLNSDPLAFTNIGAGGGSSWSLMKGFLPKYFRSERSIAQYHSDEKAQFVVAFGPQNTVHIVGMDGSFYRCSFDPVHGGQMLQQEYVQFIKSENKKLK